MFKLFITLARLALKKEMQYPASFLMLIVAHFLASFAEIFGIWVLFERFKLLKGWTITEACLIYGIMQMGFSLAEVLARGFDKFSEMVKRGEFDRVLLRPKSSLFQIAFHQVQLMRLGRFFQGLILFCWACFELQFSLFSLNTFILILSLIGTFCLFYSLFIFQATFAFWSHDTLEIMNITTYGGLESGQYPMSIYKSSFKNFFTFIIPMACVAYFPISAILNKDEVPFAIGFIAPFAGGIFVFIASLFWKWGVNRYHSTGN